MPREPTGNPTGHPPFEPTDDERKTVELMVAVGIPQEGIALCVRDGIDDKTLRKHFRNELDTAKHLADAKVAGAMFRSAIGGNVAAQTQWTKCRMGWKDTTVQEHTGGFAITIHGNDAEGL